MPFWTLTGLRAGRATTRWPLRDGPAGQEGVLGMPRLHAERCAPACTACVETCPSGALGLNEHGNASLDYARCITCQLCIEVCPEGALEATHDWAFGTRDRNALRGWPASRETQVRHAIERAFGRSLHVRHVDAGSCNGCESEIQTLNNPFYNLHRLGIFFTPSPRFADLLLVTGPVTRAMRAPLEATYAAMPEPRWVMAAGTCATGGYNGGGYACHAGLEGLLPVDLWLPGCPPNPAAFIDALLLLLERRPPRATAQENGHAGD
ncbi:4Fe-4S dicluster domain-containing protein [Acidihalobacter ferrooxydans]|uniref:NADH:ubiquinone oxidoreductase n=1 Tax=Acidihalobacter ferrooxydans TaxID=1765967 RepID=A0A1P8UGX0_9GAMM|nr:4Fe-4S dicluster domain-containing protein [Acidihalobacter ferrooxydans]APZ43085.1 NADH:ubiquinone oxidoreductase [Acidihalobacter ferrooxydans]